MYPETGDVAAAMSAGASAPEITATCALSTGATSVVEEGETTRHESANSGTSSSNSNRLHRSLSGGVTLQRSDMTSTCAKEGHEEEDEDQVHSGVAGARDIGDEDALDGLEATCSAVSLTGKRKKKKKR